MALPPELLRKIRKIEIHSKRIVQNQLSGQYQSVFKGQGISFSEIRQYTEGDDIRTIDWNVTARMNEAFVKVFTEERDRTINLLVDVSGSTLFGSAGPTKREQIVEIAALIAFSAIANQDKVGLILFTDEVEKYVPPKRGRKHVLRILTEILKWQVRRSKTDISAALEFFANISTRPTIAFLISDMQSDGWHDSFKLVARRHDLVPVVVRDQAEETLPNVGVLPLRDMETGEVQLVDTSRRAVRRMQQEVQARRRQFEDMMSRLGCDTLEIGTGEASVEALQRFFNERQRRLGL